MKHYDPQDLPTELPLLPLHGFTLYPRMQFPISLDERHERAMLDDAIRGSRMIGIIQPIQVADKSPPLYRIGTAARITGFEERDDGSYVMAAAGVCRFRLIEEISSARDYRLARVDYTDFWEDLKIPQPYRFQRRALVGQLHQFFDGTGILVDWDAIGSTPDGVLLNTLSTLCPFDVAEKQALLEAGTMDKRLETLQAILTFATIPARETYRIVH